MAIDFNNVSSNPTTWEALQNATNALESGKMGKYVKIKDDKVVKSGPFESIGERIKSFLHISSKSNLCKAHDMTARVILKYCDSGKDNQTHIADIEKIAIYAKIKGKDREDILNKTKNILSKTQALAKANILPVTTTEMSTQTEFAMPPLKQIITTNKEDERVSSNDDDYQDAIDDDDQDDTSVGTSSVSSEEDVNEEDWVDTRGILKEFFKSNKSYKEEYARLIDQVHADKKLSKEDSVLLNALGSFNNEFVSRSTFTFNAKDKAQFLKGYEIDVKKAEQFLNELEVPKDKKKAILLELKYLYEPPSMITRVTDYFNSYF